MRRTLNAVGLATAILCTATAACRNATEPQFPEPCRGPLDVSVAAAAPPVVSWSPRCGISALTLSRVAANGDADEPVWGFRVPELSPAGPPVAYGKAPARATEWMPARPLVAGARYRVTVLFLVGGDVIGASGAREFVWWPPD